jgi:hypothetical protein
MRGRGSLQIPSPNGIYLDVFTIANRCAPFANLSETRVSFELIGVKLVIRPVTPVFDVVNRSPI